MIGVVIPVYRPGSEFEQLAEAIAKQSVKARTLIIETGESSRVKACCEAYGFDYLSVSPKEFNHGGTRNLAVNYLNDCDTLVFVTQDAVPIDVYWLEKLIAPLRDERIAGVFARQIPRPNATPIEAFSRRHNYPEQNYLWTANDVETMGVKAYFFSNVCAAVRRDAFTAVGGFPNHTIMNEDMLLASRLLRAGFTLGYHSEAQVVHSHSYTLGQQFQRNFDIGVFFAQFGEQLSGASTSSEGLRYLKRLLTFLWRERRAYWIPMALLDVGTRFIAFQLGKHQNLLPKTVKRQLSMHQAFWQ
jgi:rhamnosyltransferase